MLIKMKNATREDKLEVRKRLPGEELEIIPFGQHEIIIAKLDRKRDEYSRDLQEQLSSAPAVEEVITISEPYQLTSRKLKPEGSVVDVDGVKVGDETPAVMAGPCSVENREQLLQTAEAVKKAGAEILRGGAFKPRTSPYSFQGLGEKGLELLQLARKKTGLKIVTELMDVEHRDLVAEYTDIIQIGSRNMKNYSLLKSIGKIDKPVMLKRGMASPVKDWLLAAEYVMSQGNHRVMLCERGIKTFGEDTRYTMDLSSIPLVKEKSHLPVIADPSHGTGRWELVIPMARAAVACGADGLLVEVHPEPKKALSDGPQSLKPEKFARMMKEIRQLNELDKMDDILREAASF
ncbi:3-deoxy-7-phosphoheptulonate synthase [Halarsenatibacter silvermanii]|uniref:3-deoxy-D-arabinoheptulosonate-7-phosphate synthase n=1 Tax=Halarsenatibacter silvermanii TaxID=321763 RepID=A0A1G9QTJ8_9FIRM|nr:3-deoxy-7-phosphoheptulonate synthase [Halarsenatibacter silvermanii]SDM14348.1 3-deoxy-D-arabinoheptulosonate-7-phosphate synthase [Halarsenatibacter silvermanii]